jgi:hypothetical protein
MTIIQVQVPRGKNVHAHDHDVKVAREEKGLREKRGYVQ